MPCIAPPELSDDQLLMYIDGEVDDGVEAHLKQCAACRERAEALARLQKGLSTRLFRIHCPTATELGEFHLRLLPANQALVVAQHVRECPHCAREVAQLGGFLSDLAGERKVWIAELVNQGGKALNSLAQVSVRGSENEPYIYQADEVQIVVEVQDDTAQPGQKALLGLVTGLRSNGFMVEAYRNGDLDSTTFVDGIGNFLFDHLTSGLYDLILLGPETEIRIQAFAL